MSLFTIRSTMAHKNLPASSSLFQAAVCESRLNRRDLAHRPQIQAYAYGIYYIAFLLIGHIQRHTQTYLESRSASRGISTLSRHTL